jgi:hypothetical protein
MALLLRFNLIKRTNMSLIRIQEKDGLLIYVFEMNDVVYYRTIKKTKR